MTDKILSDISETLKEMNRTFKEVAAVLKHGTVLTKPKQVTAQPQPQPPPQKPKREATLGVEDVRMKFPEELDSLLTFGDAESHIWIKPQGWLGKKDFAKVADIVKKELGGEYVSAGKDSHFRIDKQ